MPLLTCADFPDGECCDLCHGKGPKGFSHWVFGNTLYPVQPDTTTLQQALRKRDVTWCWAMLAVLDIDTLERVLACFRQLREDSEAVEP